MRYVQKVALILLPVMVLALAGCSGSSSGNSASDPLSTGAPSGGIQGDGSVLNHNLTLLPSKTETRSNEELIVTATLKDSGGSPVANQTINFSILAGPATAVTTLVKTDSNGVALAFIKTGLTNVATTVIVQGAASINSTSVIGYGNLQVYPSDANLISARLSLSEPAFTVSPNQEVLVTATAKDSTGNPLANQAITFSIAAGPASMVSSSATTDSNGVAIASAKAGNPAAIANVIVQASTTANANLVTAVIPFQIVPAILSTANYIITMTSSKQTVGNSQEFFATALLKDSGGNPVSNQTVTFSVANGPATVNTVSANTDSNGNAIATIKAGDPVFTSTVILQASTTISGTVVTAIVPVQVIPPDLPSMTLTPSKQVVDNNEEFYVTALLKDSGGNPVIGQTVSFTVATGPGTVNTVSAATDSTGKAIATVKAGNPASTSAIILQASATISGTMVVAIAPVQVAPKTNSALTYSMTLTPSKTVVDNSEEFYVTALLKDSGDTPVIGQTVSFTVATGEASFVTATANTDSTGKAIARVRALNPASTSSVILQASATVSGTQVTALAPVQITTQVRSPSILKMTLASDKASVGINADVLLTASITDSQEFPKPVQNQPISFSIVAGSASIIDSAGAVVPAASINSDSAGNAVCRLKSGAVNSSSSIIVQASTTVSGAAVNAYTTIQIVRQNSMIINFLTTKKTTDPDGTLNTLQTTIPWDSGIAQYGFVQLVPFQILDGNGVPMPNVNVAVAVYSAQGQSLVDISPPSPLVTDDHGMGIFNVSVVMTSLPLFPGTSNSDAIVYVATASANGINLKSYGGFIIGIARDKKTL